MKTFFLVTIILIISLHSFSQKITHTKFQPTHEANSSFSENNFIKSEEKTTHIGSTYILKNITNLDTLSLYKVGKDSGYANGMNIFGDQSFAEQYKINGADSSVSVIGVVTLFGGTVNPISTKTINLNIWNTTTSVSVANNMYYNCFPNQLLDILTVPITKLGIATNKNISADTLKTFFFLDTAKIKFGSFFVGYSCNYDFFNLSGDTIGLISSKNGERINNFYTLDTIYNTISDSIIVKTVDTIIYVQNATQWSDNSWNDNFTQNDSLYNDLAIYPIVIIDSPTQIRNISNNNTSFYGVFPNPCTNQTIVKISTVESSDIIINLIDMNGQIINCIEEKLQSGDNLIPISTIHCPSGMYIYTLKCKTGFKIAGMLNVQ